MQFQPDKTSSTDRLFCICLNFCVQCSPVKGFCDHNAHDHNAQYHLLPFAQLSRRVYGFERIIQRIQEGGDNR